MKQTWMRLCAVLLAWLVFDAAALADSFRQLSALGRLRSVGYYSAMNGEFLVSYTNGDIPWGSRVFLRHGYRRSEFQSGDLRAVSSWNEVDVREMGATAPYAWQVRFEKQLYSRGSSWQFTAVDFVIEIVYPDGQVRYDKGSDSTWGYYEADAPLANGPCYPFGESFCDLPIRVIVKY